MKEFANSKEEIVATPQKTFDNFNEFIFSNDTKILAKLVARTSLINSVSTIPGDIVECGVFKGSGIITWLKLKKILYPNSFKKIIGFDMFDDEKLISMLHNEDKEMMAKLFSSRSFKYDESYREHLIKILETAGFYNDFDFELIKGDVSETTKTYSDDRIGAKISLLYMDLDLGEPTYNVLKNLWNKVSRGGMVVFDEYGYHQWSETIGVDKFVEEYGLTINTLDYQAPTAYIVKV